MKKIIALFVIGAMAFSLASCDLSEQVNNVIDDASGEGNYEVGDSIVTDFFTFSVDSASTSESYEDSTPSEGMIFVVVEITIDNTYGDTLPMYSSDFQIQWGDGDEDYGYAVAGSMNEDYDVEIDDIVSGDLVFEVPEDSTSASVAYQEFYDDGTSGSVFFVDFSI